MIFRIAFIIDILIVVSSPDINKTLSNFQQNDLMNKSNCDMKQCISYFNNSQKLQKRVFGFFDCCSSLVATNIEIQLKKLLVDMQNAESQCLNPPTATLQIGDTPLPEIIVPYDEFIRFAEDYLYFMDLFNSMEAKQRVANRVAIKQLFYDARNLIINLYIGRLYCHYLNYENLFNDIKNLINEGKADKSVCLNAFRAVNDNYSRELRDIESYAILIGISHNSIVINSLNYLKIIIGKIKDLVKHLDHFYRSRDTKLEDICVICQEIDNPGPGEDRADLYCGHMFHAVCIEEWFKKRPQKLLCPLCKREC
jgi:hypothetical protein